MALYDVNVKIDLAKPVGALGFGMPLLLLENATKTVAYTEVNSAADVLAAGFEDVSDFFKTAQLLFSQEHAPKKIAVCAVAGAATEALRDVELTDKGWRQLIVISDTGTASTASALCAAVEALEGKMLFLNFGLDEETGITVSGIRRTVAFFCDPTENAPVPVAALVGNTAGRDAGSFTYKNLILSGLEPQNLTAAEVKAIHDKGGITFVVKAGDAVTSEGKVLGGEYIDVVDSEDYVVQQIAFKTQKALNLNGKLPYSNAGISVLEGAVVDALQNAFNMGIIAVKADGFPDYSVSFALREETSPENRSNRHYPYGSFRFALAGAIHTADINGEITV